MIAIMLVISKNKFFLADAGTAVNLELFTVSKMRAQVRARIARCYRQLEIRRVSRSVVDFEHNCSSRT